MKELQKNVNEVFTKTFGRTPLKQRLDDILGETMELYRYTDLRNLKEETGDLLASTFQLASECGWTVEELVNATLDKIKLREKQYLTLGRKTKVAIYGGAFNPITNGHIRAAQLVLNTSKTFDEVWLMPAFQHIYNKDMVDAGHRLKMCQIASQVDGRIKVFDYEIKNQMKGETYNLVKRLQDENFAKNEFDFSFIIGLDQANTFDKWVNYELLERMIRFVVIPRIGYERTTDWFLNKPHIYLGNEKDLLDVSSTEIRKLLLSKNDDKKLNELMDINVINYIKENKLYE